MTGEAREFERAADDAVSAKREQSTISFPYLDLDTAVDVANAVYKRSGLGTCELDELAAEMNQTMSGAFRLKSGTARIFDLVAKEGKSAVKLTDLGRQIVAPDAERAARAEAFMRVPLYSAVFEKYRGHLLPPMKALEREMVSLGVSPKQADKARQAFERSARQAGYFESGEERLVRPKAELPTQRVNNDDRMTDHSEDDASENSSHPDKSKGGSGEYHPFIEGLLSELPKTDEFVKWTVQEQAEWLSAAASIFKLLSKAKGRVLVKAEPDKETATQND